MSMKRWKASVACTLTLIAIATLGGVVAPASASPTPSLSDNPEVTIEEISSGFSIEDTGIASRSKSEFLSSSTSGEEVSVTQLDDGVPVVLRALYSLPSELDPEAEYAEAQKYSSTEMETELADVPEGEPAVLSQEFSSKDYPEDGLDFKPNMAFAVKPTSVTFNMSHAGGYEAGAKKFHAIYLEDKLLGIFDDDEFTLQGLEPDTTYSLKVISSEQDPTLSADPQGLNTTRVISVTTPFESYEETVDQVASAAAALDASSQAYMHTTFIEDQYVDPGTFVALGCGGSLDPNSVTWFGGDNRDFATPATYAPSSGMAPHRTYVWISMNYLGPDASLMTTDANVAATHRYTITPSGTTVDTATASASGIVITPVSIGRNYGQAVVNHSVKNPFCLAGAITYHDEVRFYRTSNIVEINGWRYPVPNHEISASTGTYYAPGIWWLPTYWGPTESFNCLLGYCTRDDYLLSQPGVPVI